MASITKPEAIAAPRILGTRLAGPERAPQENAIGPVLAGRPGGEQVVGRTVLEVEGGDGDDGRAVEKVAGPEGAKAGSAPRRVPGRGGDRPSVRDLDPDRVVPLREGHAADLEDRRVESPSVRARRPDRVAGAQLGDADHTARRVDQGRKIGRAHV